MNTIATLIRILAGIIYVGGFIAGLVFADEDTFVITLSCWGGAFYSGTITLGIAETISLLQKLVDKSAEPTVIVEQKPSDIHPDLPSL